MTGRIGYFVYVDYVMRDGFYDGLAFSLSGVPGNFCIWEIKVLPIRQQMALSDVAQLLQTLNGSICLFNGSYILVKDLTNQI